MLSVILPIYNGAATLGEQLEALKTQQYAGEWELIAVDNRSSDGSVEVLQRYQAELPQLRLVAAPAKQSKGYAANVAAQAARGQAFIFCDQDDVVAPGWLAALATALATHEFVTGQMEESRLNQAAPPRPLFSNGTHKAILGFLPFACGCNWGLSRRAFEAVGGFAEDCLIANDVELSWRLQLHGYKLHEVADAIVYYRYRQSYGGLWRQTQGYGESHVDLYQRFAAQGMPRSSLRRALGHYGWLISHLPALFRGSSRRRARWIYRAAACWGRLKGSVRYRTLYL